MDQSLPTLKEIARRLNVSVSTVSRGLAGHTRIGFGTRMRVQQMAKELGYEPNPLAVNFRSKKTYIVGVIVPFVREEFFSNAICGIDGIASQHNYTILFGQSYDDIDNEIRLIDLMKRQRVDGLIISLSKATSQTDHIDSLSRLNIPVVYFDRVPAADAVNKVYCDVQDGTTKLVDKLLAKGVRRIALINGPDTLIASKDRLSGYMQSMAKFKLKVDMQRVQSTDFSVESTFQAMRKLMSMKAPPQAIVSFNDYVHMDAIQYAIQNAIKINDEVLFASFTNLPITSYTIHPPLMALEQYPYRQGESAMNMLLQVIDNKSKGVESPLHAQVEVISPTLVEFTPGKSLLKFD
ncbi:LacI family DNA-binding transcriptional regulator [Chitinophagaceae bacterium 26-R-25]|nr:LacI family DNA-binding transcriptional regulator [Chitinophagaceae bacterium 26-R-25]